MRAASRNATAKRPRQSLLFFAPIPTAVRQCTPNGGHSSSRGDAIHAIDIQAIDHAASMSGSISLISGEATSIASLSQFSA
jgi:hypothetical protein